MNVTETTGALSAALAKVQAELPKLERDRTVQVDTKKGDSYSYSYVTLANLSDAVLPLLAKHGLAFTALPGTGTDGKMCLRYYLLHESGEKLSGEFPISGEGGIQMIGGRISYSRRYCLAAVVGVAADEDDESRLSEDGVRGTAQRAATSQRRAPAERNGGRQDRPTAQRAQRASGPALPGDTDDNGPVQQAQHRHMHALWRELDMAGEDNRDVRLEITSKLVGRRLESSAHLTYGEASRVIDLLKKRIEELKAGES